MAVGRVTVSVVGFALVIVLLILASDFFFITETEASWLIPTASPSPSPLPSPSPSPTPIPTHSPSPSPSPFPTPAPFEHFTSTRQCTKTNVWWNSTCLFHNVCWNPVGKGKWIYFHQDGFNDSDRAPRIVVPPTYEVSYEDDMHKDGIPVVEFEDVSTEEFDWDNYLVLFEKRNTIIAAPVFWNYGHALMDCIYGIYKIMARWNKFGYYDKDLHIELTPMGGFHGTPTDVFSLIHDRVPKYQLREMTDSIESDEPYNLLQCYDTVMIGTGSTGVHGWGHYVTRHQGNHTHFRDFVLKNIKLEVPPPSHPVVMIVSREGYSRSGVNEPEMISAVKSKYENTSVEVRVVKLQDYELKDQIKFIQEATVYLSIAGTSTHPAIFLKEGATLLDAVPDFENAQAPYHRIYVDKFWCENQDQIICVPFLVQVFNRTKEEMAAMAGGDAREQNIEFNISYTLQLIDTALSTGINQNIYQQNN